MPHVGFFCAQQRGHCCLVSMLAGGWVHQHVLGSSSSTASFISPTVGSMMAMMRKPVRSQAASDAVGAARRAGHGLCMSHRDLAASRQCPDIPTETLSLSEDFVVINKVSPSLLFAKLAWCDRVQRWFVSQFLINFLRVSRVKISDGLLLRWSLREDGAGHRCRGSFQLQALNSSTTGSPLSKRTSVYSLRLWFFRAIKTRGRWEAAWHIGLGNNDHAPALQLRYILTPKSRRYRLLQPRDDGPKQG